MMNGRKIDTQSKKLDITECICKRLGSQPIGKTATDSAEDASITTVNDPDKAYVYDKLVTRAVLREFKNSNVKELHEIISYSPSMAVGNLPRYIVVKSKRTGQYMKGYYHDSSRNKGWAARVPGNKYDMLIDMIDKGTDIETIVRSSGIKHAKVNKLITLLKEEDRYLFPEFLTKGINKYKFLPNYIKSTNNYVFFEWFNDYTQATPEDFLTGISSLKSKYKLPIKNLTPSALFMNVVTSFHEMYTNEQVDVDDVSAIPRGDLAYFNDCKQACITVDNISYDDIVIKREAGEIVDWKFVDIGNFNVGFPRYVFNMDETYPDLVPEDQYKNGVFCCHDDTWYRILDIDDIE